MFGNPRRMVPCYIVYFSGLFCIENQASETYCLKTKHIHKHTMSQDSPYLASESINHTDNNSCNGLTETGEIK